MQIKGVTRVSRGAMMVAKPARKTIKPYYDISAGPLAIRFKNPVHTFQQFRFGVRRFTSRMGALRRIAKSWGELHSFFETILKGAAPKAATNSQLEEYRSWVYIATSVIYRRVSEIGFRFYRMDTGEEVKSDNPVHPVISKIFTQPNPFMNYRFLKSFIQLQLDLTGQAFMLRIDDGLGLPYQLWPLLTSDLIKIHKGKGFNQWITGYTFKDNNRFIDYSPDKILYFNYPHPKDPREGFSPVQAQAYAVDVDHYIEVYERDFFKNSARPDILLKFPQGVSLSDEEEAERIKSQWKKAFSGEGQFHSLGILDSGGEIEQLTPKNADLDLMFLANWSQEKILAAYNVPPGKVGLVKDVNRANAVGIDITFNSESILPRLILHDDVVTRGILHKFDDRLQLKHDNPVPRDRQQDIEEIKTKVGVPIWTPNEGREVEGKKPIPGGDVIYVPLNFIPMGEAGAEEEPEGEEEGKVRIIGETKYPEKWRKRRWFAFKAFVEGWQGIWKTTLKNLFIEQQEEVLQKLDKYVKAIDSLDKYILADTKLLEQFLSIWKKYLAKYNGWSIKKIGKDLIEDKKIFNELCIFGGNEEYINLIVEHLMKGSSASVMPNILKEFFIQRQKDLADKITFDWDENIKRFRKRSRQLTTQIVEESGREQIMLLGLDTGFDVFRSEAATFIGEKVELFSSSTLFTKVKQLKRTLKEGFEKGENIYQLSERVKGVYGNVIGGRYEAIRIARTETVSASNGGAHLAYEQSGIVKEKEWLSVKDARTRGSRFNDPADHLHMDGQRRPLKQPFIAGRTGARLMFPGDTSLGAGGEDIVMCRCSLLPHTTDSEE